MNRLNASGEVSRSSTHPAIIVAAIALDASHDPRDRLNAVKLAAAIDAWDTPPPDPTTPVGGVVVGHIEMPPLAPPPTPPDLEETPDP